MLSVDRNAVICDLAETYHIFDYRQLSPKLVATLVVGLRDDSRIKMKFTDNVISFNQIIMVSILDHLKMLVWLNSDEGSKGTNKPKSLLKELLKDKEDTQTFSSPEEFEQERRRILERSRNGN